ncbi:MAG: hypothetical protein KBA81_04200 [Rhabdochlamydiaceae bacterium]|nr:hypothetical protein [Rhabdochlamydiaceae bacterium]
MALKTALEFFPKANYLRPMFGFHLWGRPYTTTRKVEALVSQNNNMIYTNIDPKLAKRLGLKSYETFKESAAIKKLFGNEEEKVYKAYQDYCLVKINRMKQSEYGGNPANIV